MRQRARLKLASWDRLHHLSVTEKKKKKDVSITHVAVIKRLSPRSASTGCLLHLSLIWLLALIWGNASLTGIQSSLRTRSLSTAAAATATEPGQSTSALCEEPGEETLSNKVSVRTNASFSRRLGLAASLPRPRIPPSLSLSVIKCDDFAPQRATSLVFANDFHPSVPPPCFQRLSTLEVKISFPRLAAQLALRVRWHR